MNENKKPIPSRVYNAAVGGHVCGAEDVDFGAKVVHLVKYDKNGNEVSFASQLTNTGVTYVIHDDFELGEVTDRTVEITTSKVSNVVNPLYTARVNARQEAEGRGESQSIIEEWDNIIAQTAPYYYYQEVSIPAHKALHIKTRGMVFLNSSLNEIVSRDSFYGSTNNEETVTAYVAYIYEGAYELREDNFVAIPQNCILQFDGGSVSNGALIFRDTRVEAESKVFDNVVFNGSCGNDVPNTLWFGLDNTPTGICSPSIQTLFAGNPGNVIFSTGTYNIQDVDITGNVIIQGIGDVVLVGQPKIAGHAGVDHIFAARNLDFVRIENITITGDTDQYGIDRNNRCNINIGPLYFDTIDNVELDNINFYHCHFLKVPRGTYNTPNYEYVEEPNLALCDDCSNILVTNCVIDNCHGGEQFYVVPTSKSLEEINVTIRDCFVRNITQSNTPFTIHAGKITFENNVIDGYHIAESVTNLFGNSVYINNNKVRNCTASKAVFDTCEYRQIQNRFVSATNNDIEAEDGQAFVIDSVDSVITNNRFKGWSFLYLSGTGSMQGNSCVIRDNFIDATYFTYNITPDAEGNAPGSVRGDKEGVSSSTINVDYPFKKIVIENNYVKHDCYNLAHYLEDSSDKFYHYDDLWRCIRAVKSHIPSNGGSLEIKGNTIETESQIVPLIGSYGDIIQIYKSVSVAELADILYNTEASVCVENNIVKHKPIEETDIVKNIILANIANVNGAVSINQLYTNNNIINGQERNRINASKRPVFIYYQLGNLQTLGRFPIFVMNNVYEYNYSGPTKAAMISKGYNLSIGQKLITAFSTCCIPNKTASENMGDTLYPGDVIVAGSEKNFMFVTSNKPADSDTPVVLDAYLINMLTADPAFDVSVGTIVRKEYTRTETIGGIEVSTDYVIYMCRCPNNISSCKELNIINSGSTGIRNALVLNNSYNVGFKFFNTDSDKEETWNGNHWIDKDAIRLTWPIIYELYGLTRSSAVQINVGAQGEVTIYPNEGYELPETISVVMGGSALTVNTDFTYNNATGSITIMGESGQGGIMGDVVISARSWWDIKYKLSNLKAENKEHPAINSEYTTKLSAYSHYNLPSTIVVKMGGVTLNDGYTYNPDNGDITINSVTGDVVIEAVGVQET